MKALLIEWNSVTGERAGKVDPNDPKLQCYSWQNMDVNPAIELRMVEDDRNLSQYETINGIIILEGKDAINAAITENFPARYSIEDKLIYEEHVRQEIGNNHIIIDNLPDNKNKRLKELKDIHHIKGIRISEPYKV